MLTTGGCKKKKKKANKITGGTRCNDELKRKNADNLLNKGHMMMDDIPRHKQAELKNESVDEWRALLPVAEGWARSMYESSGWGSR